MQRTHQIAVTCVVIIAGLIVMSVAFVRHRAAQAKQAAPASIPATTPVK